MGDGRYSILENHLYTNLTARFVQSHDYIAMERLFEIHASGEYDLIVVDTPPTRNAVDFLEAAEPHVGVLRGAGCCAGSRSRTALGGKRSMRMINFASRPFYQLADRVLGSQFLEDIAEFFLNFQSMYDGFVESGAGGRAAAARSPDDLRGGHDARGGPLVRGRALLPGSARTGVSARCARAQQDVARQPARPRRRRRGHGIRGSGRRPGRRAAQLPNPAFGEASRNARVLRTVGESYTNFSVVAMREAELRTELAAASPTSSFAFPASSTTSATSSRWWPSATSCSPTRDDVFARYHLRVSTLDDLARLRNAASAVRTSSISSGSWRAGGRWPTCRSPTSCSWRRSPARKATGSWCWRRLAGHRPDELPAGPGGDGRRRGRAAAAARAWRAGDAVEADTHVIGAKERVRVHCIPVRRAGKLIALLTREAAVTFARQTGDLERTYLEAFERFARMVADGSFPFDLDEVENESAPRVGDGVILIDAETG